MELNLKGKKALVTGGSKGIGKAIKEELEREGVVVTSISREEGYNILEALDLARVMEMAIESDILINNVGGGGTWKFDDWFEVMQLNYFTTLALTTSFLEPNKKWGRVITISSIYGKEKGGTPWFNAAKSAQISLMKNMAGKYEGITFNTICPGHIDTNKPMPGFNGIPGRPEDIAGIVTFLCSDKAKWINGACIVVDNGESKSF